jgi:hypothetical protein
MSTLPPELDFSTADGREATPERMNRAMAYIVQRFKAAESVVPEFQTAIDQLKATGLERLDEVLTPLLTSAQAMSDEIVAIRDALATPAWRAALLADAVAGAIAASFNDPAQRAALINDVITEIGVRNLYIKTGAGSAGATLTAGSAAPDNATGANGDIYVQFTP